MASPLRDYAILMLFWKDLLPHAQNKTLDQIDWMDLRWGRRDCEMAHRVDLMDKDGNTRTLKNRPKDPETKVVTVTRPDSFRVFKIELPWNDGVAY